MSQSTESADIVIIGAGPTGLYAAYYAGFRGLRTVVIDTLLHVGGQVQTLYPEKQIRDVAAIPEIRGRDFVQALRQQAESYATRFLLGREARLLRRTSDGVEITLDDGTTVEAGGVLVTAGIGAPTPRPLGCGEEWLGSGLSYVVVDPAAHAGQDVVVVGGGDSALDWADALADVARSVTLVHRRETFRGHAASLARVRQKGVTLHTGVQVVELRGSGRLQGVALRHNDGSEFEINADHVVAALGFISRLGPLQDWGLQLEGRALSVDRWMRTSSPRVYAAGDVAGYPGRVGLLSVAFGEAATAVNHLAVELDSTQTLLPGHSTDEALAPVAAGASVSPR